MSQDISDIDRYPRSGKFICIMLSPRRRDRGTVHHFYEIYFLISLLDLFVHFFWYASGIYVILTTFKPFKCSANVARNLQKLDKKGKHSILQSKQPQDYNLHYSLEKARGDCWPVDTPKLYFIL